MTSSSSAQWIDRHFSVVLRGIGLFLLVSMLGCDTMVPGEEVSFDEVKGINSLQYPRQLSGTRVFRSVAEWEAFTEEHHISPRPDVDFSSHIVLGIFWGDTFYGGCHGRAEAIESVHEFGGKLFVEIGPMSDLGICRAIVFPRQIVQVARVDFDVHFFGKVPGDTWMFAEVD